MKSDFENCIILIQILKFSFCYDFTSNRSLKPEEALEVHSDTGERVMRKW